VGPEGFRRAVIVASTDGGAGRRGAMWAPGPAFPVLAGGGWYPLAHVAPDPLPVVRWQAVRVLWPPCLLLWLGRRNQRPVEAAVRRPVQRVTPDAP